MTTFLDSAEEYVRYRELALDALRQGFELADNERDGCYWLTFGIFSQPCPTLGDVAAALQPGSGWRKLVERVKK